MKPGKLSGRQSAGFTLIELMVTVAIIGILASIALPSYQGYMTRGRIPDATSVLAAKRVQMEQFFQDRKSYVDAPACTAGTSKYFNFDCEGAPTDTAFKLRATGTGPMAGFVYSVDQSNVKATTAAPAGWATSTTCWVTAKSGSC